jgi:hypothetical protein
MVPDAAGRLHAVLVAMQFEGRLASVAQQANVLRQVGNGHSAESMGGDDDGPSLITCACG